MRKIILNKCYGGFDLSKKAYELYAKKKGLELYAYINYLENEGKYKYSDGNLFEKYFTKDFGNNVEISEEDYEKYYLYLGEKAREDKTLIEVVEDVSGAYVDKYHYEINYLPEMIVPITITSQD